MYRTKAAHELIDDLHCRIVRNEMAAEKETDPIKRAVFVAWVDATELALMELAQALPNIEAEALLTPEVEEPFSSYADMAGDYRDMPAVA